MIIIYAVAFSFSMQDLQDFFPIAKHQPEMKGI